MDALFTPTVVGRMKLRHRLAMAPMTRDRARPDGTPTETMARYYAQRASLGLLISEGTQPSEDGQGYMLTPGIHTDAHTAGWSAVADAVHAAGGHLVIQLMHTGRRAHPDNTPHHRRPVAPSAIAPGEQMLTASGMREIPVPRALSTAEVRATVDDFRRAAARAVAAGADGVEIHGANEYLVHQFLAENSNHRTDAYGGSPANRARFALELAAAVAGEIGPDRTGFRISPATGAGRLVEGDTPGLYRHLVAGLARLGLAYLHVLHAGDDALLRAIRAGWPAALLVNRPGRPRETLAADVEAELADVVPVGRWALANPDLVERLRRGAPFNEPDPATYYGGGEPGYTDYPVLS